MYVFNIVQDTSLKRVNSKYRENTAQLWKGKHERVQDTVKFTKVQTFDTSSHSTEHYERIVANGSCKTSTELGTSHTQPEDRASRSGRRMHFGGRRLYSLAMCVCAALPVVQNQRSQRLERRPGCLPATTTFVKRPEINKIAGTIEHFQGRAFHFPS